MRNKSDIRKVKAPDNLNDIAKKEFKRIKDELITLGYYEIDQAALLAYLTHYSYWYQAKTELDKSIMQLTPNGYYQPSTWVSILNSQSALLLKYIKELGFSSLARKAIGLELDTSAGNTAEDDLL